MEREKDLELVKEKGQLESQALIIEVRKGKV